MSARKHSTFEPGALFAVTVLFALVIAACSDSTIELVPRETLPPTSVPATATGIATQFPSPAPSPSPMGSTTATPSVPPIATATTISTSTPTPTVTRASTLTPTLTPTPSTTAIGVTSPSPTPVLTPIPTLEPTPIRQSIGNLSPVTPRDWGAPLIVAAVPGLRLSTSLSAGGETYFSWAVHNTGPFQIPHRFFTDLYLDGVLVERWVSQGIEKNTQATVTDWDEHVGKVKFSPGTHVVKLVVDSTGLIPETDETDNEFEQEFTWAESTKDVGTTILTRLPDLVPYTPPGWSGPLVVSPYSGSTMDAPLSLSVPSYVRYSVENQGLSSVQLPVWVHLFLDDILVETVLWDTSIVQNPLVRPEWDGLYEVVRLTPGDHTLKMVVDPANLVVESDETNNVFETRLTWSVGPVGLKPLPPATPVPVVPDPLMLPNLVPGWKYGWDGPIIVSHDKQAFVDGSLTVDMPPFVDIVVSNQSPIGIESGFAIDLYMDGEKIANIEFTGEVRGTSLIWKEDWDVLAQRVEITEGAHTLRLVIDPDNLVDEANEEDNVYEKTFVWGIGEATAAESVTYTDSELTEKLSGLRTLLDARDLVIDSEGDNYTAQVFDIAEAGYFLMTGTSLMDERVQVWLLSRDDYLSWIDDSFNEQFAKSDGTDYASLAAERERIKTIARGFKTRRFGRTAVVIDAQRPVTETITSLVHELGHMRQDLLAPAQTDATGFGIKAIHEAQAQQFERAFWLTLEEFTRLPLMAYPDIGDFHSVLDRRLDRLYQQAGDDEHSLGYLIQWLAVLDDPALAELRLELTSDGALSAASSLILFGHLIGIDPEGVLQYVEARLDALSTLTPAIAALAHGRLVQDLDPELESRPELRAPALLSP